MRHHNANRKFGRVKKVREALLRSLIVEFVKNEAITTTEAKAKELRPHVEKIITRGKAKTVATRRLLTSQIGVRASKKVVDDIAPRYVERPGGYTRIIKLGKRAGDAAAMAHIELV